MIKSIEKGGGKGWDLVSVHERLPAGATIIHARRIAVDTLGQVSQFLDGMSAKWGRTLPLLPLCFEGSGFSKCHISQLERSWRDSRLIAGRPSTTEERTDRFLVPATGPSCIRSGAPYRSTLLGLAQTPRASHRPGKNHGLDSGCGSVPWSDPPLYSTGKALSHDGLDLARRRSCQTSAKAAKAASSIPAISSSHVVRVCI